MGISFKGSASFGLYGAHEKGAELFCSAPFLPALGEMQSALHLVPSGPTPVPAFPFEGAMGAADGPVAFVDQRMLGELLHLKESLDLFPANVQ